MIGRTLRIYTLKHSLEQSHGSQRRALLAIMRHVAARSLRVCASARVEISVAPLEVSAHLDISPRLQDVLWPCTVSLNINTY